VENYVENEYDELLDSIKSENDDFINSYFDDNENSNEFIELQDEISKNEQQNDETTANLPVENYVEIPEEDDFLENPGVKYVENLEDMLKTEEPIQEESSCDEEIIIEEPNKIKEIEELHTEEDNFFEEDLTTNLTNEELINLIDKTNNSEDFFNAIERSND
jgi:hypothetical protein